MPLVRHLKGRHIAGIGWIGQLIVAAAGACVLIYVARLVRRKHRQSGASGG
nr:GlsB/YeaQ/YmgE family stress response membrane protein [uncultured Tateyamaria sp.]